MIIISIHVSPLTRNIYVKKGKVFLLDVKSNSQKKWINDMIRKNLCVSCPDKWEQSGKSNSKSRIEYFSFILSYRSLIKFKRDTRSIQNCRIHVGNELGMSTVVSTRFAALYRKVSVGQILGWRRLFSFHCAPLLLHLQVSEYRHQHYKHHDTHAATHDQTKSSGKYGLDAEWSVG